MRAMMKIWVSGASGQVGTAITDVADPLAFELLNTDVEELDITEIDEVLNFCRAQQTGCDHQLCGNYRCCFM